MIFKYIDRIIGYCISIDSSSIDLQIEIYLRIKAVEQVCTTREFKYNYFKAKHF